MSNPTPTHPRPAWWLAQIRAATVTGSAEQQIPVSPLFGLIDTAHLSPPKGALPWPAHVYCPMALAATWAQGHGLRVDRAASVTSKVTALATWRATKGIYRFDPDLAHCLMESPPTGDIPGDVLRHLPQWCVYIDLGQMPIPIRGPRVHGFFAHLEHDANTGKEELRLLLDADTDKGPDLIPIAIGLGGTIEEGLKVIMGSAMDTFAKSSAEEFLASLIGADPEDLRAKTPKEEALRESLAAMLMERVGGAVHEGVGDVAPYVSLVLYLAAQAAEMRAPSGETEPQPPKVKKTKKGPRLLAARHPTLWEVGHRVGAALRASGVRPPSDPDSASAPTGRTVRPHVRRGHWHTFWTGKGRRIPRVRWLPPTLVAAKSKDEIIPTIHPVGPQED